LYLNNSELFQLDHEPEGFEWIDPHNVEQSIIAFYRKGETEEMVIVCNFTPHVYYDYKVGIREPGTYSEIFNSDKADYGGSGQLNSDEHFSFPEEWHGFPHHIKIKVAPLAVSVFKKVKRKRNASVSF